MIDKQTVFEIHRLHRMGLSQREIKRRLGVDRKTVALYLNDPDRKATHKNKKSRKLDPYLSFIQELMAEYPDIKAPVVLREISARALTVK